MMYFATFPCSTIQFYQFVVLYQYYYYQCNVRLKDNFPFNALLEKWEIKLLGLECAQEHLLSLAWLSLHRHAVQDLGIHWKRPGWWNISAGANPF